MKTYHARAWESCVSFAHYACNQLVHSVSYFHKPFHQPCTQESTNNCLFARFLLLDKCYDVTTQMKKPISAISRLARSDSDRTISLVISQCLFDVVDIWGKSQMTVAGEAFEWVEQWKNSYEYSWWIETMRKTSETALCNSAQAKQKTTRDLRETKHMKTQNVRKLIKSFTSHVIGWSNYNATLFSHLRWDITSRN